MPKPPTLRTLAERLNLSIATVSQALRDSPRTSPATRVRVQRAAAKAGYVDDELRKEGEVLYAFDQRCVHLGVAVDRCGEDQLAAAGVHVRKVSGRRCGIFQ